MVRLLEPLEFALGKTDRREEVPAGTLVEIVHEWTDPPLARSGVVVSCGSGWTALAMRWQFEHVHPLILLAEQAK